MLKENIYLHLIIRNTYNIFFINNPIAHSTLRNWFFSKTGLWKSLINYRRDYGNLKKKRNVSVTVELETFLTHGKSMDQVKIKFFYDPISYGVIY